MATDQHGGALYRHSGEADDWTGASAADSPSHHGGDDHCRNCGAAVDPRFRRVFGDNDGRVHACLACASGRDIKRGAAALEDFDHE